jgi:hypothetical protein
LIWREQVLEDPTLQKDSLWRFVFVESEYRPLIGVDAWRPIYNSGRKGRMKEQEISKVEEPEFIRTVRSLRTGVSRSSTPKDSY